MNQTVGKDDPSQKSDLDRVLAILRRRLGLIVLCLAVTAGSALGFSLLQEKDYSATASLLFRDPGFAEDLFGSSVSLPSSDPTREAATNVKLVGLDVVAERAAGRLPGLAPAEVNAMVSVSPAGESDVVSVTATSADPAEARRIANTFAREFIAFRAAADKSKLLDAKRLAEREFERLQPEDQDGPRGEALSSAAEKLGLLASLQTGNAELVQPATMPASPSSPKPLRNGILGALLGLLLGVGLAFLLERLNRSLRDPEEAREAYGLPLLSAVPESKAIMASNEAGVAAELPFVENEAFRMLRASLRYFNVDREIRAVLIASDAAGTGKSTIAWNLARVAATSARVVLVETDLRRPSIARQHRLDSLPGLSALLTKQVGLEEAVQTTAVSAADNGTERTLDVLVAGPPPPNPAELLESEAMGELMGELRQRYDLIVVDTAPLGVVSDAFPLLRGVDGVIVVARLGQSTRDGAAALGQQLARLQAPVLGLIVNGVKLRRGGKYGYYGAPTEISAGATAVTSASRESR